MDDPSAPLPWPIFVVDFEASGLGEFTYPIEIGIASWRAKDAGIETWSALIRPPEQWHRYRIWNPGSEQIHGITRHELDAGITPSEALAHANDLIGTHTVFCDGGEHDLRWLRHLAHAAGFQPSFRLAEWDELILSPIQVATMNAWRDAQTIRHRAGDDAERLMKAIVVALAARESVASDPVVTR